MTLEPGSEPFLMRRIDSVLTIQRSVVLAHIRAIRRSKPDATPAQLISILERRYLAAVTAGGAAVGASAAIPAVGIGASLALSAVETVGFLETSALFAQSVTEVHGIAVTEPDRARALVMTMMMGSAGTDLVRQLAGQVAGSGPSRSGFWGELVTRNLPQAAMGQFADQIKRAFSRRFARNQGTNIIGRAAPFGIGAVLGGAGNHLLGKRVVQSAREAFGPAPTEFPPSLDAVVVLPATPRGPGEARPRRVFRRRPQPQLEAATPPPVPDSPASPQ